MLKKRLLDRIPGVDPIRRDGGRPHDRFRLDAASDIAREAGVARDLCAACRVIQAATFRDINLAFLEGERDRGGTSSSRS